MTKLVFIGDSIVDLGWVSNTTYSNVGVGALGAFTPNIRDTANVSMGGTTSDNFFNVESANPAQVAAAIATNPDVALISTGSNDATVLRPVVDVVENIENACALLKNAGIKVVLMTPLVRFDAGITSAMSERLDDIAAAMRSIDPVYYDVLIDLHDKFNSNFPELTGGGPGDFGVHLSYAGTEIVCKYIAEKIKQVIPTVAMNEVFRSVALGNQGVGAGNVATGWIIDTAAAGALTVAGTSTGAQQVLNISGTAGAADAILLATRATVLDPGTYKCYYVLDLAMSGMSSFSCTIQVDGVTVATTDELSNNLTNISEFPVARIERWTPEFTLAGQSSVQLVFIGYARNGAEVSGTIGIGQHGIYEVV